MSRPAAPALPAPDMEVPPPGKLSGARKPRIRDSIRLAKSQNPILSHDAPLRPVGSVSNTMSSQGMVAHSVSDRTISPMPSIPDVPSNHRSVSATGAPNETAVSSHPHPLHANPNHSHNNGSDATHQRDLSIDAAEPPTVPRFGRDAPHSMPMPVPGPSSAFHGRKRSNTGGGRVPPPLSFRGFGGPGPLAGYGGSHHAPTNSGSTNTGSSDLVYFNTNGNGGSRAASDSVDGGGWPSGRASEASSEYNRSSIHGANLFEAIGTMRMEAFISPLAYSRYESDGQMNYPDPLEEQGRARARKRNKEARRRKSRSRSRSRTRDGTSYSRGGVAAWREEYLGGEYGSSRNSHRRADGYKTAGEEEWTRGRRDPFEGF